MAPKPRASDPLAYNFGRLVRRLRRARGQTQERLAELAGLSADTIRRLEYGTFSASLDTLSKLAKGLRLDLSTLFMAFELAELNEDRELVALARSLTAAERATALRMLLSLAELVDAADHGEDQEDGEDV